jgi:4-hydroxybenzoate polyprenyltransferase
MSASAPEVGSPSPVGRGVRPYLQIARPHHWSKNLLVWLGAGLAWFFALPAGAELDWLPLVGGFVAACLLASSNYVLNELLDAACDCHHPLKQHRPAVIGAVSRRVALLEWLLLAAAGLAIAAALHSTVFYVASAFFAMGVAYNVPPLRLKDHVFIDGLAEAVNSPLRILLGWCLVTPTIPPAPALLVAFWAAGACAMTHKRLLEYRSFSDLAAAAAYRRSFGAYTARSLRLCRTAYGVATIVSAGFVLARYFVHVV